MPGELGARQKIAEILARQGEVSAAVTEYGEVVRRYAEQGQFFKATALCRVILTLDPKHQRTQQQLAELYAARKSVPSVTAKLLPSAVLEKGAIAQANVAPAPPPAQAEEELAIEIDVEELAF